MAVSRLGVDCVNIKGASRDGMSKKKESYHHGDLRAALLRRAAVVIEEEGIEALTLRGLAKDLGVSHGAPNRHFKNKLQLLSTLAAEGYEALAQVTLAGAADSDSDDSWVQLNALGKAFMRWALNNRSSFRSITHPDVGRYASDELRTAMRHFQDAVRVHIARAQEDGRYASTPMDALALFTNAVPFGAVLLMIDPVFEQRTKAEDQERLINQIIDLVVPLEGRDRTKQRKALQ